MIKFWALHRQMLIVIALFVLMAWNISNLTILTEILSRRILMRPHSNPKPADGNTAAAEIWFENNLEEGHFQLKAYIEEKLSDIINDLKILSTSPKQEQYNA